MKIYRILSIEEYKRVVNFLLTSLLLYYYFLVAMSCSYSRVAVIGTTIYSKIIARAFRDCGISATVFRDRNQRGYYYDTEGELIPVAGIGILTQQLDIIQPIVENKITDEEATKISQLLDVKVLPIPVLLDISEIMNEKVQGTLLNIETTPGKGIVYGVLLKSDLIRIVYLDNGKVKSHYCNVIVTDTPPPLKYNDILYSAGNKCYKVLPDLTLEKIANPQSIFFQLEQNNIGMGLHPFYLPASDPVVATYSATKAITKLI